MQEKIRIEKILDLWLEKNYPKIEITLFDDENKKILNTKNSNTR